jgi:hypothetical protein
VSQKMVPIRRFTRLRERPINSFDGNVQHGMRPQVIPAGVHQIAVAAHEKLNDEGDMYIWPTLGGNHLGLELQRLLAPPFCT